MNLLPPILTAFFITFILIPITIKFAVRLGLVDNPKTHQHPAILHKTTLPRAGGLPIFIGITASILIFIPLEKHIIGLLLALGVVVIDGLLDDKLEMRPTFRFLIQIFAALIVVAFGTGVTYITNPFGGLIRLDVIDIRILILGEHHLLLLADFFAVLWIVWTMNMVNWSSGVDGQMPGFVIIAAVVIALLALPFTGYDPTQWTVIKIALITAGATLAFLLFNWHPAKILPGDSASMMLGFILAFLAIFSGGKMATAVLVLAIPTLDAIWAIIRRLKRGQSPFWGDREHLHHQLLRLGLGHRQIALIYWLLAALLGGLSLISGGQQKLWLFLVAGGFLAFFLILVSRLADNKPQR